MFKPVSFAGVAVVIFGCACSQTALPDNVATQNAKRPTTSGEMLMVPSGSGQTTKAPSPEKHPELSEPALLLLKKRIPLFGSGFAKVGGAVGVPDVTEGGTNYYGMRTYWTWLPISSPDIKKGIKDQLPGRQFTRSCAVYVTAGFSDKQALDECGITWPFLDGEHFVRTRSGDMVPQVRQASPKFEDVLTFLDLSRSFDNAVLERDVPEWAQSTQKPTLEWIPRNGAYASPNRVLVVISKGGLDFHLRANINGSELVSKSEKLSAQTGQLEATETGSIERDWILAAPLCSIIVVKAGARTRTPIEYPVRIDQTPPSKIPYTLSGTGLGRAIRLKISG